MSKEKISALAKSLEEENEETVATIEALKKQISSLVKTLEDGGITVDIRYPYSRTETFADIRFNYSFSRKLFSAR